MKITTTTALNGSSKPPLQNLIDKLTKSLLPLAVRNHSFIVNDVSPGLTINGEENAVISVLDGLLRSVINNARESCIRISAQEMYGKMIIVSVKDSNSFNTYAVACSLQDVVPLAERIGGRLDISSKTGKITTIAFRFPIEQHEQSQSTLF
jgi:hypothetical protein